MKTKNPLYVIKGKDVQEAKSILDLVVKKLNLEPVLHILQNILKMLLEQVRNFHVFVMVKAYYDQLMEKVSALGEKFGLA